MENVYTWTKLPLMLLSAHFIENRCKLFIWSFITSFLFEVSMKAFVHRLIAKPTNMFVMIYILYLHRIKCLIIYSNIGMINIFEIYLFNKLENESECNADVGKFKFLVKAIYFQEPFTLWGLCRSFTRQWFEVKYYYLA